MKILSVILARGGSKGILRKKNFFLFLRKLVNLGFKPNRLKIDIEHNIQRSATKFIKIIDTEKINRTDDTYCFNETKRHAGIFNGIFTSQCEIIEYSDLYNLFGFLNMIY